MSRLCCLQIMQELVRAKEAAVAAEDYDEAKRLKAAIERLKVCAAGRCMPTYPQGFAAHACYITGATILNCYHVLGSPPACVCSRSYVCHQARSVAIRQRVVVAA